MNITVDGFLNGRIKVSQFEGGFRAGIDTVLLAAAINSKSKTILELGAGSGIATCCALTDLVDAKAVLLEIDQSTLDLACQNLADNGFKQRARTILLDVTKKGAERAAAGLKIDFFSSVIANPPFFESGAGTISDEQTRAKARHMPKGELDTWVKTAAASAAPGGEIIFIHTVEILPRLLASFHARFGAIKLLPIVPRPGLGATRMLLRGIKGSRAPFSIAPPLVLHGETGRDFAPDADAVFRGENRLNW